MAFALHVEHADALPVLDGGSRRLRPLFVALLLLEHLAFALRALAVTPVLVFSIELSLARTILVVLVV